MKLKQLISATLLTCGLGITPYVHATYVNDSCGSNDPTTLSTRDYKNQNLESGSYEFVQVHSNSGSTFDDLWGFSLAEDATASISVFDLELGLGDNSSTLYPSGKQKHERHGNAYGHDFSDSHSTHWPASGKLFDNKFLSFSLFDEDGNLVGSAGENGVLSNLALQGGEWYTLAVSAQVKGMFGSAYHGTLGVTALESTPSAVPLGDSLPFFASSLGLLGLRFRKNLKLQR